VRLFDAWGFATPVGVATWYDSADAGLEWRIGAGSPFEVDKDPMAHEYLDRLDPEVLAQYDALVVPIRDRVDVAMSRSVQQRRHRAAHASDDSWMWNSTGDVPGGAVADVSIGGISSTLANGLWDLLEQAARAGLSPIVLHFPRFVTDFDYLWAQLGHIVGQRQTRESAHAVWQIVADPDRVRIKVAPDHDESTEVQELRALVEVMRKEQRALQAHALNAVEQRDLATAERDAILASRTWRSTEWIRRLRARVGRISRGG
jgi:hypothetical protein